MSSFSAARFPPLSCDKEARVSCTLSDRTLQVSGTAGDEVLVARISGGDRNSLAVLFRRYAGLIHGIGRNILRDNAEAEDLLQDVFLHIARKSYLYDESRGSARSWIIQITYFKALNLKGYLTERHYYTALDCEDTPAEDLATSVIAEYDHSGEALFGRKRWRRIREVLTEDQWETIRLHFFEGCTFAEIGERRNLPVGNVRNHFYRGLARLRKYLFRDELQGC